MHDYTAHCGRKSFCCYCLQAFSAEQMLKCIINNCSKINGKQRVKMAKKWEYVKFKNCDRIIESPFIIYADFEAILLSKDKAR